MAPRRRPHSALATYTTHVLRRARSHISKEPLPRAARTMRGGAEEGGGRAAAGAAGSSGRGVEVRRVVNPGALRKSDASLKVALSVLKGWGEASERAAACLERCRASQAVRKEFEVRPRGVGLGAKYLSHGQRTQGASALLAGEGVGGGVGGGNALPAMLEASKAKRERRESAEKAAAAGAHKKRRAAMGRQRATGGGRGGGGWGRGDDDEEEDDEVRGDSRKAGNQR